MRRERLRRARFAFVRVLARFDRGGNRILLAIHDFFAAFEQVFGAFAKFASFALGVVAAFVGFAGEIVARVFAGLRREQQADERTDTQTNQEDADFRSTIIFRHV